MKLYYSTGSCALSPHITLLEGGFKFEIEKVDLKAKKTASGKDYTTVSPNGYVPALQLDDGQVLTEGPAIVQYLADLKPETKLAPKAGTFERARLMQWLNFISTELHKSFSPLFSKINDEASAFFRSKIEKRLDYVNNHVKGGFLMGEQFTVADGYLYTVLRWARPMDIDLGRWSNVKAYFDRVGARPKVQEALKAEGLK